MVGQVFPGLEARCGVGVKVQGVLRLASGWRLGCLAVTPTVLVGN